MSKQELIKLVTRQSDEIHVMREIGHSLRGHFEISTLLREIMNYIKNILESEACSLLLADEETDQLFFYVTDDTGANLEQKRLESGQGIVGHVYERGESLIVNNVQQDPRFFKEVDKTTGFQTRSVLCVPLELGNKRLGVVEVLNRKTGKYTSVDAQILFALANQASLAIEYVRATEKRSFNDRMAVVGNMAASIIHDLRNSMQVISGFCQVIAMEQPSQTESCDIIRMEIDKLVEMSQELLQFSQGSSIKVHPVKVSLNTFVENIYKLNEAKLRAENCSFGLELQEDVVVKLDSVKMQRAVQNIINNALEALDQNRSIDLIGGLIDGIPKIVIRDTGIGMDSYSLKNVFKPFFTKGKFGGTGLGMSIVESIVHNHGGLITVESALNQGSTFSIELGIAYD